MVLHLCDALLPRSETFVQQRLDAGRWSAMALGWSMDPDGLPIPCEHRVLRYPGLDVLPRGARLAVRRWDFVRVLRRLRPHVVHAHFGTVGLRAYPACRLLGIPLVVSFYGYDAGQLARNPRVARNYERMFRGGTVVTAEGPALASALRSLGAPAESLKLLPLGLPSWAMAPPTRRVQWTAEPLRLLQVARFVEKKGIDTTLRAVALARRRGVRLHLVLAGGGPLEGQVRERVRELDLHDLVELRGFVPHAQLGDLLAHAHAFVQPSRTAADGDTEGGHPTTLLEAQAQQVPVLGTRHADLPLAVEHGKTGWLVEEGDYAGLADAMETVARDRARLQRWGEAARPRVLRRHDPARLLALRERIYRRAAEAAGAVQTDALGRLRLYLRDTKVRT
jgi:colanic acid/amylovoran biosynthesis glycosyltransferase